MDRNRLKILAVDDIQDNLITIKALIRETFPEATILTAQDGQSGIDLAKSEDPDVIFLDIIMPGMDGFEVCKKLKSDPSVSVIPVVFITALKGDIASRIRALEAGAEAFLNKPLEGSELTAQIRAMVKIKKAALAEENEKKRLTELVEEQTREIRRAHAETLKLIEELKIESRAREESNQRFHDVFEKAPLGYQSLDFNGNFLEINQAWLDILGYSRDEVIGKWFGDFLVSNYRDAFRERFPLFKSLGKIHSEFEMIHKNGDVLFVAFDGRIGNDENGAFKQTHCVLKDITETRRAERTLKESELRFSDLVFSMADWVWEVDENGVYTYSSQKATDFFGLTPAEVVGKTRFDFMAPDEAKRVGEIFAEIVTKKAPIVDLENWNMNKNGDKICLLTNGVPILDGAGNLKGYRGVDKNITAQKLADEQIRKSESRFRTIFNELPVAIMEEDFSEVKLRLTELTKEGVSDFRAYLDEHPSEIINLASLVKIRDVNQHCALILGADTKETVSRDLNHYFGEESLMQFKQELIVLANGGKRFQAEIPIMNASGRPMLVDLILSVAEGYEESLDKVLVSFSDITEKKSMIDDLIEARKRAEESDRLKSAFLANMSHEIRTPLNSIIGFSDLLSEDDNSMEEVVEYSSIIKTSGNRLLALITDIVDLSKIEAGTETIKTGPTVPALIIREVVEQFNFLTVKKSIPIVEKIPSDLSDLVIETDHQKVHQVMSNLISNALKFTKEGHIEVGTERLEKGLLIFVKDTGTGIPADQLERIFDRFYQVDSTYTRRSDGAGLGLSLCKGIVHLLGGRIWVESEEGKGSTFYFTIPIYNS